MCRPAIGPTNDAAVLPQSKQCHSVAEPQSGGRNIRDRHRFPAAMAIKSRCRSWNVGQGSDLAPAHPANVTLGHSKRTNVTFAQKQERRKADGRRAPRNQAPSAAYAGLMTLLMRSS